MARPRSDIAPRLVQAARRRFLEAGVDGASLRQIARDARTNIGMVYYYYPTKEELFLAVVEEVYAKILADASVALAPGVPVAERVERLYRRIAAASDDEVAVLTLVAREMLASPTRRRMLVERFLRGHIPLLIGMIGEGLASGELTRRCHPAAIGLSMLAVGVVPQLVLRLAAGGLPKELGVPAGETMAAALADVVMHGVAGAKGR